MTNELITKLMMEDAIRCALDSEMILALRGYISVYIEHCAKNNLTPSKYIMEEYKKRLK